MTPAEPRDSIRVVKPPKVVPSGFRPVVELFVRFTVSSAIVIRPCTMYGMAPGIALKEGSLFGVIAPPR